MDRADVPSRETIISAYTSASRLVQRQYCDCLKGLVPDYLIATSHLRIVEEIRLEITTITEGQVIQAFQRPVDEESNPDSFRRRYAMTLFLRELAGSSELSKWNDLFQGFNPQTPKNDVPSADDSKIQNIFMMPGFAARFRSGRVDRGARDSWNRHRTPTACKCT